MGDADTDFGLDAIAARLVQALGRKNVTLSTAESCTGGLLSAHIVGVAGSSPVFLGGISAYSNGVKESVLGVDKSLMIEHGSVSSQAAMAMAQGVRRITQSDLGVGITGVAGPTGGSREKPVGYVCLAIAEGPSDDDCNGDQQGQRQGQGKDRAWSVMLSGERRHIQQKAVYEAATALIDWLS